MKRQCRFLSHYLEKILFPLYFFPWKQVCIISIEQVENLKIFLYVGAARETERGVIKLFLSGSQSFSVPSWCAPKLSEQQRQIHSSSRNRRSSSLGGRLFSSDNVTKASITDPWKDCALLITTWNLEQWCKGILCFSYFPPANLLVYFSFCISVLIS